MSHGPVISKIAATSDASGVKKGRKRKMIAAGWTALTSYLKYKKFAQAIDLVHNPADITYPGQLFALRIAFGRTRSRVLGSLMERTIPVFMRAILFNIFSCMYGANLDEVQHPLQSYKNFQELFTRALKDGVRPIATRAPSAMVSPCDGEVLTVGELTEQMPRITQVKGTSYNLKSFLGFDPFEHKKSPESVIRYAVIYLAPGDYHRFHSPTDFTVSFGRHFTGEMLPVNKILVSWFNDLFALNERVVLSGEWHDGYQLHYGIVAAYNVGKITLAFDDELKTNVTCDMPVYRGGQVQTKQYASSFNHGDLIGTFKLGSTIVLVVECPPETAFTIKSGDKLKMGQYILGNHTQ
jgi:phosphatidylserine decarboxylase